MNGRAPPTLWVRVDPLLELFLPRARRGQPVPVPVDAHATLGHVVQSLGVPLTEVGGLVLDGLEVAPDVRPGGSGALAVQAMSRPQAAPTHPPRFALDVHLGSLVRRLWLLGVDAVYRNDIADDELVACAVTERRVLLTQDRGLLMRRAVTHGAFVRGSTTDAQTDDVLDRFAPPLAPWTRCGACGGRLEPVGLEQVEHLLEPGTRRTYTWFSRCLRCGTPFWRGAHGPRLDQAVQRGLAALARRSTGGTPQKE